MDRIGIDVSINPDELGLEWECDPDYDGFTGGAGARPVVNIWDLILVVSALRLRADSGWRQQSAEELGRALGCDEELWPLLWRAIAEGDEVTEEEVYNAIEGG